MHCKIYDMGLLQWKILFKTSDIFLGDLLS